MERRKNTGYSGKGFDFSFEERSKVKNQRKDIARVYEGLEEEGEAEVDIKSAREKREEREK